MIMGHMGDTPFLPEQKTKKKQKQKQKKKKTSQGQTNKKKKKKKKKSNITFGALGGLALPPHTISNRQTCQKEKCMIHRF